MNEQEQHGGRGRLLGGGGMKTRRWRGPKDQAGGRYSFGFRLGWSKGDGS